jgi:transcriptional regulator with XRE-family HTH domain
MAPNYIGEIIYTDRLKRKLTQEEYGAVYDVSGPAIFKFEKGYVRPSLDLWLKMSKDAGLGERRAILLWVKLKLPEKYQEYVELQGASVAESARGRKAKPKPPRRDYSKLKKREEILKAVESDDSIPEGLRGFIANEELWALYKPSGSEIGKLLEVFSPLGNGNVQHYREALRLLREFRT